MTEEEMNSTNWSQSVAGVCLKDGKVLLARHTYGSGNGKLPGLENAGRRLSCTDI